MSYSKQEFGQRLKDQILSGYDIVKLARWAHSLFLENSSQMEPELQETIMQLVAMEEGPEFEFSEAELTELAEELVSGEKAANSERNEQNLSISVDPDIAAFICQIAKKKNTEAEHIVNAWLRKNMELMQTAI